MGVNVKRGFNRLYIVLAACWAVYKLIFGLMVPPATWSSSSAARI
jgi:hypothetical protein